MRPNFPRDSDFSEKLSSHVGQVLKLYSLRQVSSVHRYENLGVCGDYLESHIYTKSLAGHKHGLGVVRPRAKRCVYGDCPQVLL